MTPQVGDWVRFQWNGKLVIGRVEYLVPRHGWDSTTVYQTEFGKIALDDILELRAALPVTPTQEKP